MMLVANKISRFHRSFQILNEVEISIKAGETLVIIGPNGAGKSTLLGMLSNENISDKDEIYFKDRKFSTWCAKELAHNKAKFSQENNSDIGLLVKDVVLMGRYPYFNASPHQEDLDVIEEMMKKTDIYKLRNRHYNSLSGGEKQRVHLSRVLAQLQNDETSKLALFDEPLNNLDVRHQYNIMETIREFTQKGNAAIVVLHDLNLAAEFADKVLLLKKGKVAAFGTPEHIFTEKVIAAAYNFPCAVFKNPITQCPMIVFGNQTKNCNRCVIDTES